jgi:hypothetical protein
MPNNQAPPGVGIRECSPSALQTGNKWSLGIVVEVDGPDVLFHHKAGEPECDWHAFDDVSLDLADPTGFMHGVWAVAERQGLRLPAQSRLVHRSGPTWKIETPPDGPQGERSFVIFSASQAAGSLAVIVPELRDIPNEQPQQALAAIMRHVFGGDNA